jgi:hypothetical protein
MRGAPHLTGRIAEALRQHCTHERMSEVGRQVGLVIPPAREDVSKRDRALRALDGKSARDLGEIAQQLGVQFNDHDLEETGLAFLEDGTAHISEITRRDAAKCFGDDLCGEQNVVDVVRKLFPIDTVSAEFFCGIRFATMESTSLFHRTAIFGWANSRS